MPRNSINISIIREEEDQISYSVGGGEGVVSYATDFVKTHGTPV